jgi:hypothetical protein
VYCAIHFGFNYEAKRELIKIGAEYSIKDGKERTLEDVVRLLIEEHRQKM